MADSVPTKLVVLGKVARKSQLLGYIDFFQDKD